MKKQIYMAVLLMLFAIPAQASYDEKIQELMTIMNLDEQERYMNEQVITPVLCSFDMPQAEADNVKGRISKILNFKNKIVEMVKPVWVNNFTEEEIDEILAFYKTDVGKKTVALMPKLSQYISVEVMKYQQEITPQLNEIASELISKYDRRSDAEVQLCMRRHSK